MKRVRERNEKQLRLKIASEDVSRASTIFDSEYSLGLIGKEDENFGRKIFEKFGLFMEEEKASEDIELDFEYVVFYKGNFATFFQLYSELNEGLSWNSFKQKEAVYVYISQSERTSNILKNVMKIGDQNLGNLLPANVIRCPEYHLEQK